MRRLEGKVAVITGAASGMGRATAARFAAEGASIVIADLNAEGGEAAVRECRENSANAVFHKTDVTAEGEIKGAIERAVKEFGRLDVMFNNAGMAEVSLIHETSVESWSRVIAVTLTSTFLGLKYAIPIMRAQKSGVVINTASISGTRGDYGMGSYNAAKAGVINLTRSAALENARFGIRVNCVCPGGINTRVAQVLGKDRADEFRSTMGAAHPIGRMGEPEEIAATVTFLASDESSFITGASIVADGGITAWTGMPRMPGAK